MHSRKNRVHDSNVEIIDGSEIGKVTVSVYSYLRVNSVSPDCYGGESYDNRVEDKERLGTFDNVVNITIFN
jgi:hypothetical protein